MGVAGEAPRGRYLVALAIGALGIVYGDIGTSPLYALRESFHESHGIAVEPANVLGILSLVFWALTLIISLNYLLVVLRADNRGEGGILALTSLVTPLVRASRGGGGRFLVLLGLFGTALLYGDGIITPAISVLSAVEGLEVATPFFRPYVIPITIGILIGLFSVQHRGTGGVARIFGPVTLLWFLVLAALGLSQVVRAPEVLTALNPAHGLAFFARNGVPGFLVLGSVFLAITGAEALYADMGHFGARPIRLAWYVLVYPALVLNYLGQGALLIRDPTAVENPFFHMAPTWALYPLVGLATIATVIASQALISGAFSLTMQAVQLGYAPRVHIEHTSAHERGQIYVPGVNWALMIGCIGLVIAFGESSDLAAAYGVGVTTTMVITTILMFVVERRRWHWPLALAMGFAGFVLALDLSFWGANIVKVPHGGWFPLVVGVLVFTLLTTWKRGRRILSERMATRTLSAEAFIEQITAHPPHRVPGTAVFMYSGRGRTPPALLHNLMHNKVLHERVVLLSVETEEVPRIPDAERAMMKPLGENIYQVVLRYGFMEDPDIPVALKHAELKELRFRPLETTYFLGRETLLASKSPGMAIWREKLFALMARNARGATAFFGLPPNRVVELGAQIEI